MNKLLILIVVSFILTSCATMFNGTKQKVSFWSDDKELQIEVDGVHYSKIPQSLKLERGKEHTLKISKGEKVIQEYYIEKRISWLNLINFINIYLPIVNLAIDYSTGGLFKLTLVDLYGRERIVKYKKSKNNSISVKNLMPETFATRSIKELNIFIISDERKILQ